MPDSIPRTHHAARQASNVRQKPYNRQYKRTNAPLKRSSLVRCTGGWVGIVEHAPARSRSCARDQQSREPLSARFCFCRKCAELPTKVLPTPSMHSLPTRLPSPGGKGTLRASNVCSLAQSHNMHIDSGMTPALSGRLIPRPCWLPSRQTAYLNAPCGAAGKQRPTEANASSRRPRC